MAIIALSGSAQAQGWLQDRSASSGPGFRVGRLELHPGAAAEVGYDSNIFLRKDGEEDSAALRISAYLDLTTLTQPRLSDSSTKTARQKVQFGAGVAGSFYHYFSNRISSNVSGEGHFDLAFNPSRVFTLRLHDQFRRTIRPFTEADDASGESVSFGRNRNVAGIELIARSRSEVLQGRLGYGFSYEFFDATIFDYGENLQHSINGGFNWLFFPTSSLFYDFDLSLQDYYNEQSIGAAPTLVPDNRRFENEIGFNGAITERLSMTLAIGYTAAFYDQGDDIDTVTARAEVRYRPRSTITLRAGFIRSANSAFIGNVTRANRLFLDTKFIIGGVFSLGTKTWVSFDKSGLAFDGTGVGSASTGTLQERKDVRVGVSILGEYRATSWLAFFVEGGYLADFTDFQFDAPPGATTSLLDSLAEYQKFEAWGGVRIFY